MTELIPPVRAPRRFVPLALVLAAACAPSTRASSVLAGAPLAAAPTTAGAYTFPPEYGPQDAIWLGWSEEQRHHPV